MGSDGAKVMVGITGGVTASIGTFNLALKKGWLLGFVGSCRMDPLHSTLQSRILSQLLPQDLTPGSVN